MVFLGSLEQNNTSIIADVVEISAINVPIHTRSVVEGVWCVQGVYDDFRGISLTSQPN